MAQDIENAPLFNLFWENSKLNSRTIVRFRKQIDDESKAIQSIPQLLYPTGDLKLKRPKDRLARLMTARSSCRAFSNKPIDENQLGSLYFAFSQRDDVTRVLPSAGGKYPVEVYALLFNVRSKLNGNVVYYSADTHSLSVVGPCPSWDECKEGAGLELEGKPALMFVFTASPERATRKYGERGGRFILMEVGHYAQNLALRLAEEGLGGVISGGLHDDQVRNYLRLETTNCLVALGFACGHVI